MALVLFWVIAIVAFNGAEAWWGNTGGVLAIVALVLGAFTYLVTRPPGEPPAERAIYRD